MNDAALFPYRDFIGEGGRGKVRIFERKGLRTMHTKAAVFRHRGKYVTMVGSANLDNRSELNSEDVAVMDGKRIGKKAFAMIERDMARSVAKEIRAKDLVPASFDEELRHLGTYALADLL